MTNVIDWHARFNFGSPRPVSQIQAVFIHTTENDPSSKATNVAQWQIDTQSGSYHEIVDRDSVVICNTDDWLTWSTGNAGNPRGLHLSFVARAAMNRQQWLLEEKNHGTLSRAAERVARWCKRHNLPVRELTPAQLRNNEKGISTHDGARLAWGGTTHTDPGPGFPMDTFLDMVRFKLNPPAQPTPTPTTGKETAAMALTPTEREQLNRVHHELTHKFASREDTDNGKANPFRDTMIGFILEIDKKLEHGAVYGLADTLKRIEDNQAAIIAKLEEMQARSDG